MTQKKIVEYCILNELKSDTKTAKATQIECTKFGKDELSDNIGQRWRRCFSVAKKSLKDADIIDIDIDMCVCVCVCVNKRIQFR